MRNMNYSICPSCTVTSVCRGGCDRFASAKNIGATPAAARVMRFDFHWTPDGWRISEVNSDVPGGFSEASELPLLMTPHYPGAQAAGNPGAAWRMRSMPLRRDASPSRCWQFGKLKRLTIWASSDDLRWRDGWCYLNSRTDVGPIGGCHPRLSS